MPWLLQINLHVLAKKTCNYNLIIIIRENSGYKILYMATLDTVFLGSNIRVLGNKSLEYKKLGTLKTSPIFTKEIRNN